LTSAISVEGLSKTYVIRTKDRLGSRRRVERRALDAVTFEVPEGEVLGIIGRNGAGKTTLLRILSRITVPTAGRAVVRGRVAALLEVGTGMHPEMTGRENIFLNGALLGMRRDEVARRMEQIVEFAGVGEYLDTPIKYYSSGMRLRLAFAVGAHLSADVLVVDEVLAVGDAAFQSKCLGVMREGRRQGRTTLFVSHNLASVESLCSRVLWLDGGRSVQIGTATEVVPAYLAASLEALGAGRTFAIPDDGASVPGVRLTAVNVTAAEGGAISQDSDILVAVRLEVARRVAGLQILIRLETIEGHPVAGVSNGDYHREWELAPGRYRIEARLSGVRLLPRRHLVSIHTFTGWGAERFEDHPQVLAFDVSPRDLFGTGVMPLADRGVTWFPTEFSLTGDDD